MANNDDVLIVGSLKDEELRKSIDNLVDYVGDKTNEMAMKFNDGFDKMKLAMKDFAVTQKVSVDLMKQAWREMSTSFDAMVAAQSSATGSGSGGGSGKPTYDDNTIGYYEQILALQEKERKQIEINTDELRTKNAEIERTRNLLNEQKGKGTVADSAKKATEELNNAMSKSSATLTLARERLNELLAIQQKYAGSQDLSVKQQNRLTNAIEQTKKAIKTLSGKDATFTFGDVKNIFPEESIDEITKKMQALRAVKTQDAAEAKALGDEYQHLKRKQAELLGMNIQHTKSNNYLAQSFGYIRNRIVYALTLGAITNFTKQIYEIRSQYELLERSLGVLVDSFERGSQVFLELNKMALESPFTLMELAGAAKQLTAYNFAEKEVVDTTRRLADISAALGVPMERLTYNLGQIRAQTVLTARDARDFANAGLPVVASLAEHFSQLEGKIVTTGDVYDRMSKKMVSYSDVMAVLNSMTDEGGKFFDFQAKQAETLRVQLANLTLAWNNMLNEMGTANQGLLTFPVGMLKSLLKNWQAIDRVIKSVIISIGVIKVAQIIAIRQQWAWSAAASATAKQMGFVANMTMKAVASTAALFANPWTWAFVGVLALVDLVQGLNNARIATKELNEEIRNNANEASENMLKFLNNKGSKATLELARAGKLTAEQGDKAWAAIREQIETSAMSCEGLIAELLTIDDINERVAKGFDYSERIQKAQAALQDLGDTDIKVTQDLGWFGMFGEGLVSDLNDYAEDILEFEGTYQELQDILTTDKGTNMDLTVHFKEFQKELGETAESINNYITAYGITDPLQINEILERVRAQIKAKNPEIKGEAAKLFDLELDKKMSELTNNAVDSNSTLWKMFMDRLKRQSSATFTDINDDWVRNGKELSKEQQDAVDQNLQYFKDSMPYAYDAVAKMVADASNLKIHIGITFGTTGLTDFQKEVNKRIGNASKMLDFGGGAFLPTNNDNLSSWVKTQQQAIKSLREENKKYQKDNTNWSKQKINDNDREIQQRKNLLDLFHQQYAEEKKITKGGNRKHEDVVAEALKQELKLISEMQSNYEKLRKSGVSNMDAIDIASRGYESTIIRINQVLSKFGIDKFNAANFAGKDVRSLLKSLEEQRKSLLVSGRVKTSSLEALDVKIQKLTVDAKTYDMKKVTDGLNSELGKIKDEYELSIELNANPELGDMFADMFGIDTDSLPHTFGDAYDRAVTIARSKLDELRKSMNGTFDIDGFDLMKTNIKGDENGLWNGIDIKSEPLKELIKWQDTWRNMFKQNMVETEKMLDDYVKKYGNYSDKIAEIEADRLEKIKKLNEAYYTDAMRNSPEYKRKRQAIDTAASQEKSQAQWDNFTNTRLYVELFENLELASTGALMAMKEKLDEVKGSMNNLKPERLKQITAQYMKLEKELMSRNPFKGAIKHAKDYMKAVGKTGKQAQKDFITAQRNYDAQEKVVATLKKQYEQKKTQEPTNTKAIEALAKQLGLEEDKLAKLKEILNAADKEAQKYNMMTKLFKEQANEIAALLQAIGQNLQSLAELRDNLQSTFDFEFSDSINGAIDGLERMGKGISGAVSSAQSGDVFGIMSGVVNVFAGIGDGIASLFGDGSARTKRINKEIAKSVETVRQLNMAYKELDAVVNNAMGAQELQARREQIQNKQMQVEELQRQMQLEQSKRSKDRDDDKIKEYQESIQDLELEIDELKKDVVANLLGSDIKDAAEQFVSAWVDAWRQGGDTMEALNEKFDDMIDNMIAKSVASYLVSKRLQKIFDEVDKLTDENSEGGSEITMNELKQLKNLIGDKSIAEQINDDLANLYGALEIAFGVNSEQEKNLSELQQGIQGVNEDTAGAIEAYMNIVAQRVFEQNEYLMQIRDIIVNFNLDVQVATIGQILYQMQQSYLVQQAIQARLDGWSNSNGMAVRVEMI